MGVFAILVCVLLGIYVLTLILGIDFLVSLMTQHMGVITFFLIVFAFGKYFIAISCCDQEVKKSTKIIGLPVILLCSSISDIVYVMSLCGLGQWYLKNAQHDILSLIAMISIGLVILLFFIMIISGAKIGAFYIISEEDPDRSFELKIILYVVLSVLSVLISTALIYYVDYHSFQQNFHNGFFRDVYHFFVQINPINWLIDAFDWHFLK